jgi:hypothetical protein
MIQNLSSTTLYVRTDGVLLSELGSELIDLTRLQLSSKRKQFTVLWYQV